MNAMDFAKKKKEPAKRIQHIFKKYDRNNKGYIDMQDLKEMTKLLD